MKKTLFKIATVILAILIMPISSVYAVRDKAWAPYQGKSKVTKSYIFNFFTFNKLAYNHYHDPLYNFVHTYEHETHTDKGWARLDGYWASNMPNAYLDTQTSDWLSSVDNYAVGTVRASQLSKEKEYFTTIAIRKTKNATTGIKIKGQWGMVNNPNPYASDAWKCLFAIDTVTLSGYTGPTTSYVTWQYK